MPSLEIPHSPPAGTGPGFVMPQLQGWNVRSVARSFSVRGAPAPPVVAFATRSRGTTRFPQKSLDLVLSRDYDSSNRPIIFNLAGGESVPSPVCSPGE